MRKTVLCPPGFHSFNLTEGPKTVISHEYQWELEMAVEIIDFATVHLNFFTTPWLSTLKIKISDKFRWYSSFRQSTQGQGCSFGFKIKRSWKGCGMFWTDFSAMRAKSALAQTVRRKRGFGRRWCCSSGVAENGLYRKQIILPTAICHCGV